jgi:hypothetical protein
MTNRQPIAERPYLPEGYGLPEHNDGLLPWTYIVERMTQSQNYWICSVRPDGRPHSVPVWAAWVDDVLYYDGAPNTIHNRNVAANPSVSVHLENGTHVVIMEGIVNAISKPEQVLAEQVAARYRAKYAAMGYDPKPEQWDAGGLYAIVPARVIAWTKFPTDCTRWRFDQS